MREFSLFSSIFSIFLQKNSFVRLTRSFVSIWYLFLPNMEEGPTTVVNDENGSKFAQLNLLLDKAKMYSQFIGQQITFVESADANGSSTETKQPEVSVIASVFRSL